MITSPAVIPVPLGLKPGDVFMMLSSHDMRNRNLILTSGSHPNVGYRFLIITLDYVADLAGISTPLAAEWSGCGPVPV